MTENGDSGLLLLDTKTPGPEARVLMEFLSRKILGQPRPIKAIGEAWDIKAANLKDLKGAGPIGSWIFIGPTATGKTSLAEALAEFLFEDPNGLTRIRGAEMTQPHHVARLIGSPPGYVGYSDPKDTDSLAFQLSQFNIDKPHRHYLRRLHKEDLKKTEETRHKFEEQDKATTQLLEKMKELVEKMKVQKEYLQELKSQRISFFNKRLDESKNAEERAEHEKEYNLIVQEEEKVEKELNELEQQYQETKKKFDDAAIIRKRIDDELNVLFGRGIEEGWIPMDNDLRYPYTSIILFDEFDRADEDIWRIFYDILDKGRITLSNNMETNFGYSFVFFTSNLGSQAVTEELKGRMARIGYVTSEASEGSKNTGELSKETDQKVFEISRAALEESVPAPLLGRVDGIEYFRPLTQKITADILDLRIKELMAELNKNNKSLNIEFDDSVKEYLLERIWKYKEEGARMIRKRLNHYILVKLARLFNNNLIAAGDTLMIKRNPEKDAGDEDYEPLLFYKKT
jgi:flagellar biosynthesis GTPase FlhF